MDLKIHIAWVYAIAFSFIGLNLWFLSNEWYFLLALPLLLLALMLILVYPKQLIYFLAFATPLSVQLSAESSKFALSLPTEPLIILLLIGLGLKLLHSGKIDLSVFKVSLAVLLLTDLLWQGACTITSTMPLITLKYVFSKLWYLAIFYFLLIPIFKKEKAIKTFIWVFALSSVVLASYTLLNHAQGSFSRSYAYTAMRPFLPDHGMYAAMLSFVIPPMFVFFIYGKSLRFNMMTRFIAAGICLYLLLAVGLSFTRASWLSLLVAFGVYGALLLKIKFRYLLLLAMAGLTYVSINFNDIVTELSRNKSESDDNIEEHLQSVSNVSSDPSNLERLNRWSCAYRMFEEKPVMGFGPGTYTFQYGVYQLPHEMTIISTNTGSLGNVHSEYLRPLVEEGLPGFTLFLAIVALCSYMGFDQYKKLSGARKALSLAAFMALITYFTHGVLNNYSEFDKIAVPLYACMAILTAQQLYLKEQKHVEETQKE